jgi:hypothetical protein
MSQLLDDLRAVDVLLSDETKWTSGTVARNAQGSPCTATDLEAVRWCILGAIERVCQCNHKRIEEAVAVLSEIAGGAFTFAPFGAFTLASFNDADETDFTSVKALLAKVIGQKMDNHVYYECMISVAEAERVFWKTQKKKTEALKRSPRRRIYRG